MNNHVDIYPTCPDLDLADRINTCRKLGITIWPDRATIFARYGPLRFSEALWRKQQTNMQTCMGEANKFVTL
ncbi:hypothetical protein D9M69_731350 [compost metagenome]